MQLVVTERTIMGKHTKDLRASGLVPGVIYGRHVTTPLSVQCNKNAFLKLYHEVGKSKPFDLVDEKGHAKEMVLIHDIQLDPVMDYVMHVDFLALKKDEKVRAEVELRFVGESPLEKNKLGRIQKVKDVVEIEALPRDLPKDLEVDVSTIAVMHDVLFVKDIILPKGVVVTDDPDLPVVITASLADDEEVSVTPPADVKTTEVKKDEKK